MNTYAIIAASFAVLSASGSASAINIVQNPGFEEGSLHWRTRFFATEKNLQYVHTGAHGISLTGCTSLTSCLDTPGSGARFGQLLDTREGGTYDLSFWVRSASAQSAYSVFWDGVMIARAEQPNGPMIQYSFTGLPVSGEFTMLEVHGYNDKVKRLTFDDFSVVRTVSPVPEPGSVLMLLGGLGVVAGALRRRRA